MWLTCVSRSQFCTTLCDPMDCSPPGFSVHGIFQARILEWPAIPFSRGSSQPRDPSLQADSLLSKPSGFSFITSVLVCSLERPLPPQYLLSSLIPKDNITKCVGHILNISQFWGRNMILQFLGKKLGSEGLQRGGVGGALRHASYCTLFFTESN